MKIDQIEIENYRGIKYNQIIPINSFASIVGKNDSGKSIIVNAIASFLDPKAYKLVESDFNDQNNEIAISCRFTNENMKEVLRNKLTSKIKKDEGLEEYLDDIIFGNKILIQKTSKAPKDNFTLAKCLQRTYCGEDFMDIYSKSDEVIKTILEKYSIEIPVSGSGRNSKMEKIKHIKQYCIDNSIEQKNAWIEDRYKISDLLPAVELFVSDYGLEADTKFKTNSISEIKGFFEDETENEDKRLSRVTRDIQKEMNKEADSIKDFMSDYVGALEEVIITPEINWIKAIDGVNVKFKFKGDACPILMSHKGAGYRRLFMVARFRYLAEKNKGSNVIYLIEEPETFLHPSAQEELLQALKKLSEKNQVIITTHSPVFAGSTKKDSIILCIRDAQSTYRVSNVEDNDQFILQIIEELGIKPHYNLRDSFEKIIFVEGKDDIFFYNKLSEVLFGKSLDVDGKVLVLPFGGSSINSFINIEYFLRQVRPLYLLLDSDKSLKERNPEKPKGQEEAFCEFNKKNNSKAYMLGKSCIENYLHPRALERFLHLEENSLNDFLPEDNMDDVFKKIAKDYNVRLSKKNNRQIFNLMTSEEFESVVEPELREFISEILNG